MQKISRKYFVVPGPLFGAEEEAFIWTTGCEAAPFVPGVVPDFKIYGVSYHHPEYSVVLEEVVLVISDQFLGMSLIRVNESFCPIVCINCELFIASPIETDDNLDYMLEVLDQLQDPISPLFAAAIARCLTPETLKTVHKYENVGSFHYSPSCQVLAALETLDAPPTAE